MAIPVIVAVAAFVFATSRERVQGGLRTEAARPAIHPDQAARILERLEKIDEKLDAEPRAAMTWELWVVGGVVAVAVAVGCGFVGSVWTRAAILRRMREAAKRGEEEDELNRVLERCHQELRDRILELEKSVQRANCSLEDILVLASKWKPDAMLARPPVEPKAQPAPAAQPPIPSRPQKLARQYQSRTLKDERGFRQMNAEDVNEMVNALKRNTYFRLLTNSAGPFVLVPAEEDGANPHRWFLAPDSITYIPPSHDGFVTSGLWEKLFECESVGDGTRFTTEEVIEFAELEDCKDKGFLLRQKGKLRLRPA